MTYIRKANDWSKIILQYSTDIKELELQVLLHGYKILENTLKLGLKLGYTLEELEQAYWKKNKINWERIKNHY